MQSVKCKAVGSPLAMLFYSGFPIGVGICGDSGNRKGCPYECVSWFAGGKFCFGAYNGGDGGTR